MNIKNGLTDEEVLKSREKNGSNIITNKKKNTFLEMFISSLGDPIIRILIIALGIKLVFLIKDFDWYETVGIVIAILVASLISSISEYGSMKAFNKLTEESSQINVKVKRNGIISSIPINEVVVNDLVVLETGDKVPADGIIVFGSISVDESMMNGEAKEVYKEASSENSLVYMSTVVYSGSALMLVRSVGDNTFYGKMAQELQEDNSESPLKIRLSKLAQGISRLGYICSLLVALSYLIYMVVIANNFDLELIGNTIRNGRLMFSYLLDALTLCVTIIVVSVPDGLYQL